MEKNKAKIIWATGISGCGRKEHLKKWADICERQGKKVKIYNVGQEMIKHAAKIGNKTDSTYILNTPEDVLSSLRGLVFEKILGRLAIERYQYDAILINVHTCFFWNRVNVVVNAVPYLNEFRPDMFVCFIDSGKDILARLNSREQWQDQGLTESHAWQWQNIEYNNTFLNSEWLRQITKKDANFFAIPVGQRAETLYYLLFEPWRPTAYPQMPMTHLSDEEAREVHEHNEALWKWFVLFDPWAIETGGVQSHTSDEDITRNHQTVILDRKWYIGQSQLCIAYFPKITFTVGVIDEIKEAIERNRRCLLIFPSDNYSPFFAFNINPRYIFKTRQECYRYITESYLPAHYKKIGYNPNSYFPDEEPPEREFMV